MDEGDKDQNQKVQPEIKPTTEHGSQGTPVEKPGMLPSEPMKINLDGSLAIDDESSAGINENFNANNKK